MTSDSQKNHDIQALRNLVSEQVFMRGQACHDGGNVSLVAVERERAAAHVRGVHVYYAELTRRGAEIAGTCGCVAGMRREICEHIVAVALAVDASEREQGTTAVSNVVSILTRQGKKARLAVPDERGESPRRRPKSSGAARKAGDESVEAQLREAIDAATDPENILGRRATERWARNILTVFDSIRPMTGTRRAPIALRLIDHAVQRIEQAAEVINDPDSWCRKLHDRARTIHLNATKRLRPDPVQLGRVLFEREHVSGGCAFRKVLDSYRDLLGEAGLAEYRSLAEAAWRDLQPLGAKERGEPPRFRYNSLLEALEYFAQREGDVEKLIALRTKDLSAGWNYEQLINLCRSHGKADQAVHWAEAGMRALADDPSISLVRLGAKLLTECGRKADAEAWLRAGLEKVRITARGSKSDVYGLCHDLCVLGGAQGRDRAIEIIEEQIDRAPYALRAVWPDLLLEFLLGEELLETAFLAALKHEASWHVRRLVAQKLEPAHLSKAVHLYADIVWQLLTEGTIGQNSRFPTFAMPLINRLAALQEETEHVAFLDDLKRRFASKRAFIKQLGFHDESYRAGTFKPLFPTA
jgi:hypothetical protein